MKEAQKHAFPVTPLPLQLVVAQTCLLQWSQLSEPSATTTLKALALLLEALINVSLVGDQVKT